MGSAVLTTSDAAWAWSTTNGATTLTAELLGAGGGGGGETGYPAGGGGGKGGSYVRVTITKGTEDTLNITVPSTGGTAGSGGVGGSGGYAEINQNGTVVALAPGGVGGAGGTANDHYGAGATTVNGTAVYTGGTLYTGGNGGSGQSGPYSGAGGGAAGPTSDGGNGDGTTAGPRGSGTWGDGGTYNVLGAAGRGTAENNGIAGGNYGAGGSGGCCADNTNHTGGAGGPGIVVLTWQDVRTPGVASLTLSGLAPALALVVGVSAGAVEIVGAAPTVSVTAATAELRQGTTVIATRALADQLTTSLQTLAFALTTEERAAITDWTALRVYLSASARQLEVSWVQFETPAAGATPGTYTPGPGTIAITGLAPPLQQTWAVLAGAVEIVGLAPTAALGTTATPEVGSVQVTGLAPTLAQTAASGAATVAIVGLAPTLQTQIVTDVGTVQVAGLAPSVGGEILRTPETGTVALTGAAPGLTAAVTPDPAALQVVGLAPTATITAPNAITPGVGAVEIVGLAPALLLRVTPGVGAVQIAGTAPSLTGAITAVGDGYTDGSCKQIVRTSAGVVYTVAADCAEYSTSTNTAATIRVHKATDTGLPPSGFTRKDQANEPSAVAMVTAALDGSDDLHIAWVARDTTAHTKYLRYCVFDTGTDTFGSVTTILSNLDYTDIGQGEEVIAIAVDADSKAHLAFGSTVGNNDVYNRRLYYTNNVSGSWAAATQVDSDVTYSGGQRAWHPGLAFDVDGRLVVSWLRGADNNDTNTDGVLHVRTREVAGTWNSTVAVATGLYDGIDQCVSLLVTADGRYHVGYSGPKDGGWQDIQYRYSDDAGQTWTANHPSGPIHTHNVTVGPGNAGGVRLHYHGAGSPVNWYYLESAGGGASWGSPVLVGGGNYECSFNTRWSRYHHHSPDIADTAGWLADYPCLLRVNSSRITLAIPVPTGTVRVVGAAPTVGSASSATPGAGAVQIVGAAPGTTLAVGPAPGVVTFTGAAPALTMALAPATGTLQLTPLAPQAALTSPAAVTPGVGTIALQGAAPVVLSTITPSGGAVLVTGLGPTTAQTVAAGLGAVQLVGLAPTAQITSAGEVIPPPGTVTLDGAAPTLVVTIATPPGAVQLVGLAPSSGATIPATPGAGTVQVVGLAPTLWVAVTPDVGTVRLEAAEPSLRASVATGTGAVQITALAPTRLTVWPAAPSSGTVVVVGLAPTLQQTVATDVGTLRVAGAAPDAGQAGPATASYATLTAATPATTFTAATPAATFTPTTPTATVTPLVATRTLMGLDIINEKTSHLVTVAFFDESGGAITPTSATYRLDAVTEGQVVQAATAISGLDTTVLLHLTPAQNAALSHAPYSERALTVEWAYSSTKGASAEYRYKIKNLVGVQ